MSKQPPQNNQPNTPEGEPRKLFRIGRNTDTPSSQPKELGRVSLSIPYQVDVRNMQASFFPESKHLRTSTGDEYILDTNGRTLILFENPTEKGFTSIYSPLTPNQLKKLISILPTNDQEQLIALLGLEEIIPDEESSKERINFGISTIMLPFNRERNNSVQAPRKEVSVNSSEESQDLPTNHFLQLTTEEFEQKRHQKWYEVKDLDDNDPRKIVYLRRFTEEFRSNVYFNPELTNASSNPYQYYEVDASRMSELRPVEPYHASIEVPAGKKIGIVIGYHHLEKPWGHIFREMFQKQVEFDPNQIEFIIIQNKEKPTGEESRASEREIQAVVRSQGLTHIIDVHEQLARLNHYMDGHEMTPEFREPHKSGAEGEYTLDPFVPTWMIEQYYEGHIYPQLQYAVNDQVKRVENLIKSIS